MTGLIKLTEKLIIIECDCWQKYERDKNEQPTVNYKLSMTANSYSFRLREVDQ